MEYSLLENGDCEVRTSLSNNVVLGEWWLERKLDGTDVVHLENGPGLTLLDGCRVSINSNDRFTAIDRTDTPYELYRVEREPAEDESANFATDAFEVVHMSPDQSVSDAIAAGVAAAKHKTLKPYVYFSASWCAPCRAISSSLRDSRMQDAFAGTYIMKFDVDEWEEFPNAFDISRIPVFYEVDAEGVSTGRSIRGSAWGEDIPENMAPSLKAFFNGAEG